MSEAIRTSDWLGALKEIDMNKSTYEQPTPTCPSCGYALDDNDMNSDFSEDDLFALAPNEGRTVVTCPQCDHGYWVQGGYAPTYTSAFSEEEL